MIGLIMNNRIRLMAKAHQAFTESRVTSPEVEKFMEMIVKECVSMCGSQADKRSILQHFGLPLESDIIYPAVEQSWSVESQYKRDLLQK